MFNLCYHVINDQLYSETVTLNLMYKVYIRHKTIGPLRVPNSRVGWPDYVVHLMCKSTLLNAGTRTPTDLSEALITTTRCRSQSPLSPHPSLLIRVHVLTSGGKAPHDKSDQWWWKHVIKTS